MRKKIMIVLTILFIVLLSCKTNLYNRYYQSVYINCDTCSFQMISDSTSKILARWKIITLKNDTILTFYKRFNGLGMETDIKYKKIDSIIVIDSFDLYSRSTDSIGIGNLIYKKDSLMDMKTGIKYYSGKIQKVTTRSLDGIKQKKIVYD